MRIGQNNLYFTQYTGLGAKSNILSENLTIESAEMSDEKSETSPAFYSTRINNNIMAQLGAGTNTQTDGNLFSKEKYGTAENSEDINSEDLEDSKKIDNKMKTINKLLEKLGINGKVTACSVETVPQNYTTYYIETEGSAKNIAVLELENGELMFAETDLNEKNLSFLFGEARASLGLNSGKLSVEALKKAFAEFFGTEELRDFILEFSGMKRNP